MPEQSDYALDKRRVAAAFNRAASTYAAHAVLQDTVATRLTSRLSLFRITPEVVVDLGCGRGNALGALREAFPRASVIAIDIALEMLRATRGGAWRRWSSRTRFVCGDAERLPFADESADLLFSNLTLQWCPDLDLALRECRRVLKPEGLLLFTTLGPDTLVELRQSWAAVDEHVHVHGFTDMHDVGDGLIRAGLSAPVLDVERIHLTYPDTFAVMRDLKALGAHNASAGRRLHLTGKSRLRRMSEAYERHRRDGLLPATYEVVYGHAWAPTADTRPQDGSTVATFPLSRLSCRTPGP